MEPQLARAAQALLGADFAATASPPLNVLCIAGTDDPLAPPSHCRGLAQRLACGGATGSCTKLGGGGAEACGCGVWFREVSGGHGIPANKEMAALKDFIKKAMT